MLELTVNQTVDQPRVPAKTEAERQMVHHVTGQTADSAFTHSPTSYTAGILGHTQPLRHTVDTGGMTGTSWPTEKCAKHMIQQQRDTLSFPLIARWDKKSGF